MYLYILNVEGNVKDKTENVFFFFFSLMTLLNCTLCRQQIFELLHLYECYSKPKFCALEKLTKFGSEG